MPLPHPKTSITNPNILNILHILHLRRLTRLARIVRSRRLVIREAFALAGREAIGVAFRSAEEDEAEGSEGGDAGGDDYDVHFYSVGWVGG